MLAMALRALHGHIRANNAHPVHGLNRSLTDEAEERYITRLDKPVQRNILEIRSAIIYYQLFSSWRTRHVPLRRIRRSISARSRCARLASRCRRKKTQLRGQTAEVGVRKTVKNARPTVAPGERARPMMPRAWLRIGANSSRLAFWLDVHYPQPAHIRSHPVCIYAREGCPGCRRKASKSVEATAPSRPVIRKHNSFAVV